MKKIKVLENNGGTETWIAQVPDDAPTDPVELLAYVKANDIDYLYLEATTYDNNSIEIVGASILDDGSKNA